MADKRVINMDWGPISAAVRRAWAVSDDPIVAAARPFRRLFLLFVVTDIHGASSLVVLGREYSGIWAVSCCY